MILLSKPSITATEEQFVLEAVQQMKQSSGNPFIVKCENWFQQHYHTTAFLTPSCTAALEMAALILQLQPGDEVIVPSYTFVGTTVPFARQGAILRFADSCADHPNIDPNEIKRLINQNTKAIVVVHYAGVACNMQEILSIAKAANIPVIEDAAHCIGAKYKEQHLGTMGTLGTLSFDSQKNLSTLQGGCLLVNDAQYQSKAEMVRFNGTNKAEFFRKQVTKFEWVGIGGNYEVSNISAALLLAQLQRLQQINGQRMQLWQTYYNALQQLEEKGWLQLPVIPQYAVHNAHIFYVLLPTQQVQQQFIAYMQQHKVQALFHYPALHQSPYMQKRGVVETLPHANAFEERLVRLPLHAQLTTEEQQQVIDLVYTFFKQAV